MAVVQARVEEYQPEQLFNTIISRAYSTLANMVEGTRHLLAGSGEFIAMKGVYPMAEVDGLPEDMQLTKAQPLSVPGLDAERNLLIIQQKP